MSVSFFLFALVLWLRDPDYAPVWPFWFLPIISPLKTLLFLHSSVLFHFVFSAACVVRLFPMLFALWKNHFQRDYNFSEGCYLSLPPPFCVPSWVPSPPHCPLWDWGALTESVFPHIRSLVLMFASQVTTLFWSPSIRLLLSAPFAGAHIHSHPRVTTRPIYTGSALGSGDPLILISLGLSWYLHRKPTFRDCLSVPAK